MALRSLFTARSAMGIRFNVSGNGFQSTLLVKPLLRHHVYASFATAKDVKPHHEDIQTLIERDHFVKLRKRIEADPRKSLSKKDFYTLCGEEGLHQPQADRLIQSLSDSGIVLHFPNSTNQKLQQTVFLRPQELNSAVHSLLDHSTPASLQLQADATQAEIDTLNIQLAPLQQQRDDLERRANRRANVVIFSGLGYCVVQFLAIGRLTWWELSWDVMEPVTYMLTFATALIGYGYFVLTGSEYSYEGLKRNIKERRFQALVTKTGFDETQYQRIKRTIDTKQILLHTMQDDIYHSSVMANIKKAPPVYDSRTVAPPVIPPTPKPATA